MSPLLDIQTELARQGAILDRLELAVIGDGSAGSSLRERMSAAETDIATLKGWRHKALAGVGQTLLSACVSLLTMTLGAHHS